MASRGDVSFYRDLLHKRVVDCDGRPVGAILDLAAGPPNAAGSSLSVRHLVIRLHQSNHSGRDAARDRSLVLAWALVEAVEPRCVRLREARGQLAASLLDPGQILLRKHVMDQQVVDRAGLKLQRVNDIAMDYSEGALLLWGMDTGMRSFLTRVGYRWGLLGLIRPLHERLHCRLIHWNLVERIEPTRGHVRLRLSRDELRSAVRQASALAE